MVLLLLLSCTGTPSSPEGPVEDSSVGDTSREPWCTCDPVCGQIICASCGGCDDSNLMVGPWCDEVCNAIDDDCDGAIDEGVESTFYLDADADGHGDASSEVLSCDHPAGYVTNADDCDDANPAVWAACP